MFHFEGARNLQIDPVKDLKSPPDLTGGRARKSPQLAVPGLHPQPGIAVDVDSLDDVAGSCSLSQRHKYCRNWASDMVIVLMLNRRQLTGDDEA